MNTMDRVREHYEFAKTLVPEDQVVGVFLYGSQNYDMDGPNSDVDTKCLVVPSFDDVVFNRRALNFEHHFENGEHLKVVDVREYLRLLRKQNPNDLEALFTKYYVCNSDYANTWQFLREHREEVAHYCPHKALDTMRHMANRVLHHAEKNGFDTKSLALTFRLEKMVSDYLLCSFYEHVLMSDQADFLKKVKYGQFVSSDDAETGMRLMRQSVENTICQQIDTLRKLKILLMKRQKLYWLKWLETLLSQHYEKLIKVKNEGRRK